MLDRLAYSFCPSPLCWIHGRKNSYNKGNATEGIDVKIHYECYDDEPDVTIVPLTHWHKCLVTSLCWPPIKLIF